MIIELYPAKEVNTADKPASRCSFALGKRSTLGKSIRVRRNDVNYEKHMFGNKSTYKKGRERKHKHTITS